MQLKKESFPTIPSFMRSFMDVESMTTILHLIEEVLDFKAFIEGFFLNGDEAFVGHTMAQQFKFYFNSAGIPIMKYKRYYTDSNWLLEES